MRKKELDRRSGLSRLSRVEYVCRQLRNSVHPSADFIQRLLIRQIPVERRSPSRLALARTVNPQITMLRIIFLSFISTSFALATLKADPTPTPPGSQHSSDENVGTKTTKKQTAKHGSAKKSTAHAATTSSAGGRWSVANGVWTHPDGYKYVNGQVVRIGSQTHKQPPKPPTKAELDAAKETTAPASAADAAAAKAAERQRNLAPRPASQTGTHL